MAGRLGTSLRTRAALLCSAVAVVTTLSAAPISAASPPYLVKDIKAGGRASNPMYLTPVGNTLFFSAKGPKGRELWKTDGTKAGTIRVKDISPGVGSSNPYGLTNVNGTLFFAADDGSHGTELWKSDGTPQGTMMVEEIMPGPDGLLSSLAGVNGKLFFFRESVNTELWTSDGTPEGTNLVEEVSPDVYQSPPMLLVDSSSVFFGVGYSDLESAVWRSDGTPDGTATVEFTESALWLISPNGTYYFTRRDAAVGIEMWKSDGTLAGTQLVKDLNESIECGGPPTCAADPDKPVVLNGVMYFGAWVGGYETRSLFRSDGTSAGTYEVERLADVVEISQLGSRLVMGANSELYRSNGTPEGTSLVKAIGQIEAFGSYPHGFVKVGSQLYFAANDHANPFDEGNEELWRTDGTKRATKLVMDIDPGGASNPRDLIDVNGTLYFTADDSSRGRELWGYVP